MQFEAALPAIWPGRARRSQLDRIIGKRHWVERNELLIRVGEPFHCLYIIHGGQFKTFRDSAHGKQHVMGFHMAGEILGMNAISTGIHDSNAMAFEDSEVCEVPFAQLQILCASIPALQQHFHRILSEEINRDQRVMRFLGARPSSALPLSCWICRTVSRPGDIRATTSRC